MFCFGKFCSSLDTFVIKETLVNDFGVPSLDCKIILCKGNFGFSRVAILSHKVAGIAS